MTSAEFPVIIASDYHICNYLDIQIILIVLPCAISNFSDCQSIGHELNFYNINTSMSLCIHFACIIENEQHLVWSCYWPLYQKAGKMTKTILQLFAIYQNDIPNWLIFMMTSIEIQCSPKSCWNKRIHTLTHNQFPIIIIHT